MAAKQKYTRFTSPKGIAKFCWLDKPDSGFDGKSTPKYKARVLMEDTTATRAWCKSVTDKSSAEAKAQGVKLKKVFQTPFNYPEDMDEDDFIPAEGKDKPKYDEDHKGKIFFDTKSEYQPGLIDASLETLGEGTKIMGGDVIRVKIQPVGYEAFGSGISFRCVTVQLINKNTSFGGVDKSGFEDESDNDEDDEDEDETPASKRQSRQDLDDEIPF